MTAGTIADMFVKYWGEGLRWVDRSDGGPHEASFLRLDCTKLKEVFGWRPSWHIEKAIEETVRWSRLYAEKADAAIHRACRHPPRLATTRRLPVRTSTGEPT